MIDRSAIEWLIDARDFALEARRLASGLNQDAFDNDNRSRFAVCFCLIAVGEALSRVPRDVRTLAPEVPWTSINGLRNRLVHSYWLINNVILLRLAQSHAADLASSLDRLIGKIE